VHVEPVAERFARLRLGAEAGAARDAGDELAMAPLEAEAEDVDVVIDAGRRSATRRIGVAL
jgi:hypothetical protein